MRVLISADGEHDPPGQHYMVLDNHGLLLDLSNVQGNLHDPAITRVTWDLVQDGQTLREGGTITRRDGHKQLFFDKAPLQPYLDAFAAKRAELLPPAPAE